jgi:hypothetical protein
MVFLFYAHIWVVTFQILEPLIYSPGRENNAKQFNTATWSRLCIDGRLQTDIDAYTEIARSFYHYPCRINFDIHQYIPFYLRHLPLPLQNIPISRLRNTNFKGCLHFCDTHFLRIRFDNLPDEAFGCFALLQLCLQT